MDTYMMIYMHVCANLDHKALNIWNHQMRIEEKNEAPEFLR
jgi:hypothetical protein